MSRFLLLALVLASCKDEETDKPDPVDTGTPTPCTENAGGEIPSDVTWMEPRSTGPEYWSSALWLHPSYPGYYDTYDLNIEEMYGAGGFWLTAPGTVVGARVKWVNLLEEDVPVTLYAWPDFGSDYASFDAAHPYGAYTRCLGPSDEGTEVTYLFPEPIEISQPLPVYVGFHRSRVEAADTGGWSWVEPEIPYMVPIRGGMTEPYEAAILWPDMDEEMLHGGTASPWYAYKIDLAVRLRDTVAPEDKPFQVDPLMSVGSRVAWGDYDNDGWDDLMTSGPYLYHNEGDGSFTDVTALAFPLGISAGTGGGVWGDYDNDGWVDYFGQGGGTTAGELLLHNEGDGTFTDVTATSGISDWTTERDCDSSGDGGDYAPTEGVGWWDWDGDGLLDLYLAEYECWVGDYTYGYQDRIFRNQGDGTFSEVSTDAGFSTSDLQGRGVTTHDFDLDGVTDLFISNYRLERNFFYHNLGDGTVEEVARTNGTAGKNTDGSYGHTIGTAAGDVDNDGDIDFVAANLAHPRFYDFSDRTNVLIHDGAGTFVNEADSRGIYYRETASNPVLFDADNDGDLDLFITNVYAWRDSDFYVNDGTGHFTLQNYESGLVIQNGWGAAASDADNDGDVDLVAYSLFRNGGVGNHWLQVRAVGLEPVNASAIGATVWVESGSLSQVRQVSGGSGTSSQDSFTQHFGLGSATTVDRVTVQFPHGPTVEVEDVAADQRLWIRSDGTWSAGFAPPE